MPTLSLLHQGRPSLQKCISQTGWSIFCATFLFSELDCHRTVCCAQLLCWKYHGWLGQVFNFHGNLDSRNIYLVAGAGCWKHCKRCDAQLHMDIVDMTIMVDMDKFRICTNNVCPVDSSFYSMSLLHRMHSISLLIQYHSWAIFCAYKLNALNTFQYLFGRRPCTVTCVAQILSNISIVCFESDILAIFSGVFVRFHPSRSTGQDVTQILGFQASG